MKLLRIVVFLLITLICLDKDGKAQDSCHFHNLKTETTPLGKTIDYRLSNDSIYHIYYGKANSLRRVPGDFYCDTPPTARPSKYAENDKFIFLSSGCGTACRVGYVLPMDSNLEVKVIPHWLEYNMSKNVIVGMDYDFDNKTMLIKIIQLDEYKEITYNTGVSCDYGIPIDCFKDVEIAENRIKINWEEGLKTAPFEIKLKN